MVLSPFSLVLTALWTLARQCQTVALVSRPLVSTLVGLVLSNAGFVPCEHSAYVVVNRFLLPLSIPLLLFSAACPCLLTYCLTLPLEGHQTEPVSSYAERLDTICACRT